MAEVMGNLSYDYIMLYRSPSSYRTTSRFSSRWLNKVSVHGEIHVAKKFQQPARVEGSPQPTHGEEETSKKCGLQSYDHQAVDSINNLSDHGSRFFSALEECRRPTDTLQRSPLSRACAPDPQKLKIIDACLFKLLSM